MSVQLINTLKDVHLVGYTFLQLINRMDKVAFGEARFQNKPGTSEPSEVLTTLRHEKNLLELILLIKI